MDEQIRKYFQKELDSTDRLKLLKQVESDDKLKDKFIEYKNMYALLSLSDQADDKKANQEGYRRFNNIRKMKRIRRIMSNVASYAAIVTLLVISTYWITISHHPASLPVIADNKLYVPAGQRVKPIVLQLKLGPVLHLSSPW